MSQPTLVFLHGFMGHPSDWDEVRSLLRPLSSEAISIQPASSWADGIQQLADSIPDGAMLVGYSMGARLALAIALEQPNRCGGLVFVSGHPGLESEAERQQRWEADQKTAARLEEESLEAFLRDWYRAEVFAGVPEGVRQASIDHKLLQRSPEWANVLRTFSVARQPNYWPRLGELSVPAIAVAGERDTKYRQVATRFSNAAQNPAIRVKILPDCGHMVHQEKPEKLALLIRSFVSAGKPDSQ